MSDGFYRAFEERYYAPRDFIKTLRKQYLPFVAPLVATYPKTPTFDIGCGRGEWLELMTEIGFKPYGVDLDEGMLNGCVEMNLPAEKGDAVTYLAKLPSESQAVVSAFHVVEHISFDQLRTVVMEALRVLKPGGLLIMETPNPENIVVATQNFYLDPTHLRPIPPSLLSFLPEYYGFARIKTVRLQESKELLQCTSLTLRDVLGGVSPDYAVIAQKTADHDIFHAVDAPFGVEYGLSLDILATRYDAQLVAKAQHAEDKAQYALDTAQHAVDKAQYALDTAQHAVNKAQYALDTAQHAVDKAQQAESMAQHAENSLNAIYNSASWRITAPFRKVRSTVKKLLRLPATAKPTIKEKLKHLLAHARLYVVRRPGLLRLVLAVLTMFPALKNRLKHATWSLGAQPTVESELANLTPQARRVYADIQGAIEQYRKENV